MLELDDDACYRALLARDPRFDGLFFVGVSTTGIYCRPVCPARKPRRSSCSVHPSAAAAEAAGFRPCLRCRPELAPAVSPYEQQRSRVATVIAAIRSGALDGEGSLDDLARREGLGTRQLRRLVREHAGASPVALAQTARLLLAKQLLTETDLSITAIAFASGFSSLRRFHELFGATYRMSPGRFRLRRPSRRGSDRVTLRLDARPPFDGEALLAFLAPRAIPGVEQVRDGVYTRTLALRGHAGRVSVRPGGLAGRLTVTVDADLLPVLASVLGRVREVFDVYARPDRIDAHLGSDPLLRDLVRTRPGLRVPGSCHGFELAWRAVLGQQVSVAAATTLAGRLVRHLGAPLGGVSTSSDPPEGDAPGWLTPSAEAVAAADSGSLAALGLPRARARALVELARACAEDPDLLRPGGDLERCRARLVELPGIGPWTAEYVVMRALHWPDAFPAGDLGLRRALQGRGHDSPARAAEAWRPWRAYAALHLWTSSGES